MSRLAAHPYLVSLALFILALLFSIAVGSVFISLPVIVDLFRLRLLDQPVPAALKPFMTIIFTLRLPRTFLMAITGAALAGSGAGYQGLFRNPLADPYLIGVASGAGLGAVVAMSMTWPQAFLGLLAVPVMAFIGSIVTVWIVYQLARVGQSLPTTNLILAGVAVGSFATAMTSF